MPQWPHGDAGGIRHPGTAIVLPRGVLPRGVLPRGVLPRGVLPRGVLPRGWAGLRFTYPPWAAILFTPLAPLALAQAVTVIGNCALLVLTAAWSWQAVGVTQAAGW
jgi:hypothetical protein